MRKPVLLLVALLAVIAPACSTFGTAAAATIDGDEISVQAIEDEVDALRSNDEFRANLEANYGTPPSDGVFATALAAQLLRTHIIVAAVANELDARGATLEADDPLLDQAREQLIAQLPGGEETFSAFNERFQRQVVRQQALFAKFQEEVFASVGEDPRAFYDEHPEEFAEICLSHALVGVQTRTPAQAEARARELYERIEDGEEFETIAREESDDPTAAAENGSLGCGSKLTLGFDPVFTRAAFALEEGVVSEPVETQFGWHLIVVNERTIPPYREVSFMVENVMETYRGEAFDAELIAAVCDADISVNPRYGTWTDDTCEGLTPEVPAVEPPEGPRQVVPELELEPDFGA